MVIDSSNKKLVAEKLFEGGGAMGELMRAMDWSQTPLGPVEDWPQSLRTSVSLCLTSTFPILIAWGPEFIQIYNDAYRPICGDLHPKSMGQDFRICWASALPVVGDAFFRAKEGEGVYIKDQQMFLDRKGYLEEAFMTFSFSPIRDESGNVGGIFHPITETTEKMLSGRRTQTLREIAGSIYESKSLKELTEQLSNFSNYALDIPFMMLYRFDRDTRQAERIFSAGLSAENALISESIDLSKNHDPQKWPFDLAMHSGQPQFISNLSEKFGAFQTEPYPENLQDAVLSPLWPSGMEEPYGFLIAGASARRALDPEYRGFFELLGTTVTTAIGNIHAYEEEIKRAEALAQIDRAKTAFFSNVSHEFRTPLTLILGPLEESLSDYKNPLPEIHRERHQVTHRNALRLLKLVNSLLDFSRIEAGRTKALYYPTNLAELTKDLASVFRSTIEKAGLKLNVDVADLTEDIFIDREMWEKIVLNLLSNAFKFTFEGDISVKLTESTSSVSLQVSDTGVGVDQEHLPRLFERFHRVEGSAGRTHEGTGIGLALVQELVHLHGGKISVASVFGKGTTFSIEIPKGRKHLPEDQIQKPSTLVSPTVKAAPYIEEARQWLEHPGEEAIGTPSESLDPSEPLSQSRYKVLLADDNLDMRQYISGLLRPHFEVTEVADGAQALAQLERDHYDLILTDVMMPHLDGFGLLEAVRENPALKLTPVVMLSARSGEESRVEGINAGADDYLSKPFSSRELLARVTTNIEMSRVRKEAHLAARNAAEQSSAAKSLFVANMSHEIRTPLGAILGFAELIDDVDMSTEERSEYVDVIRRNGKLLSKIIDDVLDLSKIESEKLEIEKIRTNIPDLMNETMSLLNLKAEDKGIVLQTTYIGDVPPEVITDPTRLRQMLINLTGNAIKFTEKGRVEVKIRHFNKKGREHLEFAVIDTGLGLTELQLGRLFQPFSQADSSMSRRYGGTGLGLVLCKKIAMAMGGDLVCRWSAPNEGSEFVFNIPVDLPVNALAKNLVVTPKKMEGTPLKGCKVLLVEDSPDNQVLIKRYLTLAGASVEVADNGLIGVQKTLSGNFDLVLMDLQMPEMSGYEAIQELRSQQYKKPVLALTAHAMKSEQERSLKAGFDSYLIKPIDRIVLIETLLSFLA